MKTTALLLRGLSRNFEKTHKELFKYVKYDFDVFIHTWDIDGLRRSRNKRFSYGKTKSLIEDIKLAYNPKKIEVDIHDDFISNNEEKIFNHAKKLKIDMDNNYVHNCFIHSLISQMASFQKVVRLFLSNVNLKEYDRVIVVRFDYLAKNLIPYVKKDGLVYSNNKWQSYLSDFCHVINPKDIIKFNKIYDEIFHVSEKGYDNFISPYVNAPCAEMWYYNFIKKSGLKFRNGNFGGKLIR